MKYKGMKNWRKYFKKELSRQFCHGRCPHCRGHKGSRKKEPGFKKKEYRDIKEKIDTGIMSLNLE